MSSRSGQSESALDQEPSSVSYREEIESIRCRIFSMDLPTFTFFRQSVAPNFILHKKSGMFVAVNEAFLKVTGYERRKLRNGSIRADDILLPSNQSLLNQTQDSTSFSEDQEIDTTALRPDGDTVPVRIRLTESNVQQHEVLYGTLREIKDQKDKEQNLRDQLNETVQANKRILALTEKMKQVPILTSDLLNEKKEEEIMRRAREQLCKRAGLNYQDVEFYLFDESEDRLTSVLSEEEENGSISLDSGHPALEVATGEKKFKRTEENVFFLPLRGEDKNFGIVKITLHPNERQLMEGSQSAWSGYQETLITLSDLLGLILQNRRLYEKVRQESIHDELTGLYNRRHFNRQLKKELYRAKRYGNHLSLIIIDINDFKEINDRYGHQEGDRMLKQISTVFKQNFRESDVVCRYGGDEFGLILPETSSEDAIHKSEMMLEKLENTEFTVFIGKNTERDLQIHVSIGISYLPRSEEEDTDLDPDHNELLKAADKCMYRAKISDDESIVCYNPSEYFHTPS